MDNQTKPLVTVVTVCYNAVDELEKTMISVLNQTYGNIEYIVIDGGSTDGTVDIIRKYADRLVYWVSEPDKGLYNAMNKGVAYSTGEWLNFMNAGDMFAHESAVSDVVGSGMDADVISGIAVTSYRYWKPVREDKLGLIHFLKDSINHQSAFIRRKLLVAWPYDEKLIIASDTKFFFESLIVHDASYKAVDIEVCRCDNPGVSADIGLSMRERYDSIFAFFPVRCTQSLEILVQLCNPISILGMSVYHSGLMQKILLPPLRYMKKCMRRK